MISTVACIGFTDPSSLAAIVREDGVAFHALSSARKWVDPSGAMLLLDRAGQVARPAFETDVRTPYTHLVALDSGLAQVQLALHGGAEPEPLTVIPTARYTIGWAPAGQVALTAMGLDTEFFTTAEDFFDSPRSAMPGCDTEPPPEVRQFGLPWPPPMEIQSFLPHGEGATAVLSGTVQQAHVRTNARTGHEFLVARVVTLFGEIDLCSPVPVEGAPSPGSVAVATVQVLATFPAHGEPDASTYRPGARVPTAFRDSGDGGASTAAPVHRRDADETAHVSLAPGYVLAQDGTVRAEGDGGTTTPTAPDTEPSAAASTQPSESKHATPVSAPEPPETTPSDSAPKHRGWRARLGRS